MAELSRTEDLAGRYGGEEFIVLVAGSAGDDALAAAERLRRSIAHDEAEPRVTVSIGVATYPDDARDAEELIRAADRALYVSKSSGRNRVTGAVANPAPAPQAAGSPALSP